MDWVSQVAVSEPDVYIHTHTHTHTHTGETEAAEELWKRSQFESLERYIVSQLTDKKEAAKLKLESPLGVAERCVPACE